MFAKMVLYEGHFMNRRDFVTRSMALASASGITEGRSGPRHRDNREYFELRRLTFATRVSLERYALYLKEAFFPAIRRNASEVAGGFTGTDNPDEFSLYLLQSFPSLAAFGTGEERLMADAEFRRAGATVLNLPATDPPYAHAESSLMLAFESWPNPFARWRLWTLRYATRAPASAWKDEKLL